VNSAAPLADYRDLAEDFFEQYHGDLKEFLISEESPARAKRIVDLDLPLDVLLVLIKRGDVIIIPRGDVTLEAGDRVLVATEPAELESLDSVFSDEEHSMTVLSITTDFGLTNGFVGVMKGVIYGIAPDVKIVDISHLISPQNVTEGAYAMWRAVPFFPGGSVHVGVVDPGVGTKRRPIGAHLGDQFFIVPDNGLLDPVDPGCRARWPGGGVYPPG
jgi:hypothetical protein